MSNTTLRNDVRRFTTRFDAYCHACGDHHVRQGDTVVWHGKNQGVSAVRCYDARVEAPLFAPVMGYETAGVVPASEGALDNTLMAAHECSEAFPSRDAFLRHVVHVLTEAGRFDRAVEVAKKLSDDGLHTLTCQCDTNHAFGRNLRAVCHEAHDCPTHRDHKAWCWCNDGEIWVS